MINDKSKIIVAISVIAILSVSTCAAMRTDPSSRGEQVSVTFDKTIK